MMHAYQLSFNKQLDQLLFSPDVSDLTLRIANAKDYLKHLVDCGDFSPVHVSYFKQRFKASVALAKMGASQ